MDTASTGRYLRAPRVILCLIDPQPETLVVIAMKSARVDGPNPVDSADQNMETLMLIGEFAFGGLERGRRAEEETGREVVCGRNLNAAGMSLGAGKRAGYHRGDCPGGSQENQSERECDPGRIRDAMRYHRR